MDIQLLIAVLTLIGVIALIIIFAFNMKNKSDDDLSDRIEDLTIDAANRQIDMLGDVKLDLYKEISALETRQRELLHANQLQIQAALEQNSKDSMEERIKNRDAIDQGLEKINALTTQKLNEIQGNVNEKLDKSLNERLDNNFRQVGERLESLYKSLGEIRNLESGVASLNKTLSNVKSRGVYGELQLGNLLANILDPSQYDTNVATNPKTNDIVEFAIKIPDKDDEGGFIYLPIDAKFPTDIYTKIVEASEAGDASSLMDSQKELKTRIMAEAKTIRDKYVCPPDTTDFAVMFLPTEGLYAEVLRIPGLAESCQEKFKIVLCGPMNLTAMVNSLSVGFKYLTVNKKTDEIRRTLSDFKTQFEKFSELIEQTQKSLDNASKKTEKLSERNRLIRKRLSRVESVSYSDSLDKISYDDSYTDDIGE